MNARVVSKRRPAPLPGGLMALVCLVACCAAQELKLEQFSYHEGFEGEAPDLHCWAENGPSRVAFSGLTDEDAFEGNKSLKLDVTSEGGSYHYFGVHLKVPCEGKLKLSARVKVAEGTTARVGFGINAAFPPTHHTGCTPEKTAEAPTDGWVKVEIDLVARAHRIAHNVMASQRVTASEDDVGCYLERWSIFVYGGKGARAVVYIDDLRVEGEVPSEADYNADIERRWQRARKRYSEMLAGFRAQTAKGRDGIASLSDVPEEARKLVDGARAGVAKAEELIAKAEKEEYASVGELAALEAAVSRAMHAPLIAREVVRALEAGRPHLLFTPRAITNHRFIPNELPPSIPQYRPLECSGCRGEYESLSLVFFAVSDAKGVLLTPGELKGPGGSIPAQCVDVYSVKCWYQANMGISCREKKKLLAPELLLKDDALVRVDTDKQQNYLRSTAESGASEYILCSGPSSEALANVRPVDAAELQPVDVPRGRLKQFWINVRIPEDAAPGKYAGKLTLKWAGGSQSLPLTVNVHPFELLPSRLTYSIYYRGRLTEDGKPSISSEGKSEEQYRAEMRDFLAHGVLHPTSYQRFDERLLRRVLEIRKEVGLPNDTLYTLGRGTGHPTTQEELDELSADVKQWIEFCRPFGYREVYFYGIDEARDERLKSQRRAWRTVQEAGGKTFVACYKGTFDAMGDLLNCAIFAGKPVPDEAARWHGVGSKIFCYAYPQVGNEEPETYRRNFGLVLWKAGYDGAMDYAYQHSFGHIWNDYDHSVYRDHNFTYPTVSGIVGTVQWEGFREAVDDVRYVTTLERAIENAPAEKAAFTEHVRNWLNGLDPATADLYLTRRVIADFISRLQ